MTKDSITATFDSNCNVILIIMKYETMFYSVLTYIDFKIFHEQRIPIRFKIVGSFITPHNGISLYGNIDLQN